MVTDPPHQPVLVVGDACADLILRMPEADSDQARTQLAPELSGGGSAANTAVALARLGLPATLIGVVGDDGFGRFLRHDLAAEGVDIARLATHRDAATQVVLAVIDRQGERTMFVWPEFGGAAAQLTPQQLDPDLIGRAAWLHATGMCLVEAPARAAVLRGMELARAAGIPVSFDLNLRASLVGGALPPDVASAFARAVRLASYVLGSAVDEFTHLAPGATFDEVAGRLATDGRVVVARLGAQGALLVGAAGSERIAGFSVNVVDTVGAGDAFDAGFIAACLRGSPPSEAVRWGNAVAALSVSRAGARSGPRRDEVVALLARPGGQP